MRSNCDLFFVAFIVYGKIIWKLFRAKTTKTTMRSRLKMIIYATRKKGIWTVTFNNRTATAETLNDAIKQLAN